MLNKRVCVYIHENAIRHNLNEIKKQIPYGTSIMPVIKADGYGHGALTFANILKDDTSYFAVATVDEAVELRKGEIGNPVLVLGHTFPEEAEEAIKNDVILTITSYDDAVTVSEMAQKLDKKATVHVKIDTGMSRIGFPPTEESKKMIKKIALLKSITIDGIFTHFATADEIDKSFTKIQAERFFEFTKDLPAEYTLHAGNSAAIIQHKYASFDMMRPGIILYGLYPSDEVDKSVLDLMPVMELRSHIAFVKTIKKGDTVSYGRTFTAENDMKIATIPVGYADGYPRLLSNKGRVIINGNYAPITGRVCMDQFMVDVSHIDGVKAGDEVILIGQKDGLSVSADEIAKLTGTINYEVTCNISKRVPREVV